MIVGAIGVLLFLVFYWMVLPGRLRRAALLLAGLAAYQSMVTSVTMNLLLVLLVLLILRVAHRDARVPLAVAASLLALALNKYGHLPAFQVLGLSYVSFRLISLSKEIGKRDRPAPGLLETMFYVLFPPTFLSGPIEPYERFANADAPEMLSRTDLFTGLFRAASGLLKKLTLVEPLRDFANTNLSPMLPSPLLWSGLFAYSLFLYLDFSSYSDLAIGLARLFGYRIGENFRWPYFSASIAEFWTRWHISLSQFLRDHVFVPLCNHALKIALLARSPTFVGISASLVTMILCGMWHGNRSAFVAWGFGHGLLLGAHQLYRQKLIGRLKAKQRMRLQAHPVYRAVAILLTFVGVSLLWVPFRFSLGESSEVYGRLFSPLFQ